MVSTRMDEYPANAAPRGSRASGVPLWDFTYLAYAAPDGSRPFHGITDTLGVTEL